MTDLATEEWIFVEVTEMWFGGIKLVVDHVTVFLLLVFKLLSFGHRVRVHNLVVHSHLRTGLPRLVDLGNH